MENKGELNIYDWFKLKELENNVKEYKKLKRLEGKKIKRIKLNNK